MCTTSIIMPDIADFEKECNIIHLLFCHGVNTKKTTDEANCDFEHGELCWLKGEKDNNNLFELLLPVSGQGACKH